MFLGNIYAEEENTCQKQYTVTGSISEETFEKLNAITTVCLDEKINTRLVISSSGGDLDAAVAIFDTLTSSVGHHGLTTVVQGRASSAAVLPFLAGYNREIGCNASLLIHEPYFESSLEFGDLSIGTLQVLQDKLLFAQKVQTRLYHKITKVPYETLKELLSKDTILSAEKALALGFATKIIGTCSK